MNNRRNYAFFSDLLVGTRETTGSRVESRVSTIDPPESGGLSGMTRTAGRDTDEGLTYAVERD
jgi:hypothetical protein